MNFLYLPDVLVCSVLSDFLKGDDLIKFDLSVANDALRPLLLSCYKSKAFVVYGFGSVRHFRWFTKNKIKFQSLYYDHYTSQRLLTYSCLPVRFLHQLNCKAIHSINFDGFDKTHLHKVINSSDNVKEITCHAWDLDDNQFKKINVRTLKKLTKLNLIQCSVTQKTVQYLADRCTELLAFDFQSKVNDNSVRSPLLEFIQNNSKLQQLSIQISNCIYTGVEFRFKPDYAFLETILFTCSNLTKLHLNYCSDQIFCSTIGKLINDSKLQIVMLVVRQLKITINTMERRVRVDYHYIPAEYHFKVVEFLVELERFTTLYIFYNPPRDVLLTLLLSFRVPRTVVLCPTDPFPLFREALEGNPYLSIVLNCSPWKDSDQFQSEFPTRFRAKLQPLFND